MAMIHSNTRSGGFTLVELMMTLLIAAVLLGIGVPGLASLMERNRLQSAADTLFTGLMLTRSEALKRNREVTLCKSSTGTGCTSAAQWHQGWLVYTDTDNDSAADPNEILRVEGPLKNGDTLFVSGSDFADDLTYTMDGSASGTGSFVFCNAAGDNEFGREVQVELTGRPRIKTSTTDCTP